MAEVKKRVILIAVDDSEFAEKAFDCKYLIYRVHPSIQ